MQGRVEEYPAHLSIGPMDRVTVEEAWFPRCLGGGGFMHGFRGDTDEFGVAERLSGRLISCRDLMTSAVAVVCASYGVHVEGHERDKDEADKPLAFRPFTSDVK